MDDSAPPPRYLHGYSPEEQARLVEQAEYWRERLILPDLPYRAGERLLDVGCGAGAVLGVIASAFPGLNLAGIDREPKQIEAATAHLGALGVPSADLRVGDANRLPWPDRHFDHAYLMWFVEHVQGIEPILREIRRVLKPGGTITINETEYESYHVWPENADWEYLEEAMFRHFQAPGEAHAGQDGAGRAQAPVQQADRGACAERIAAEIEIDDPQMLDQRFNIERQHVGGIGRGVVRRRAVTMGAEIGHDDLKAGTGNLGRRAEFAPVHRAGTEQPVQQDDRAASTKAVPGDARAIEGQEIIAQDGHHAAFSNRPA